MTYRQAAYKWWYSWQRFSISCANYRCYDGFTECL